MSPVQSLKDASPRKTLDLASGSDQVARALVTPHDFNPTPRRLGRSVAGGVSAPSPERIVVEADEITFKVGSATLSLTKNDGGTLEIRAAKVHIVADSIVSEATGTNSIVGEHLVAEAAVHADLLGKLIRIDGQCVRING